MVPAFGEAPVGVVSTSQGKFPRPAGSRQLSSAQPTAFTTRHFNRCSDRERLIYRREAYVVVEKDVCVFF